MWRLYEAGLTDGPAVLTEATRWLYGPNWAPDGKTVSVRYSSAALVPPNGPNIVAGILTFDPDDSRSTPGDGAVQAGGLAGVRFSPSPDGRSVILERATAFPTPADLAGKGPGSGFLPPTEVTQLDVRTHRALRLEGFPGHVSVLTRDEWSRDGAFFLAFVAPAGSVMQPVRGDIYAVPVIGGRARYITSGTFLQVAWSPVNSHDLTYIDEAGALWLFDADSGSQRRLSADSTFETQQWAQWWRDGRHAQIRNWVIDVSTSTVTTYPTDHPGDFYSISPDGRYMLTADTGVGEPGFHDVCPPTQPPQNRVYLYDRVKDQSVILKDCDGRYFYYFDWLADSRHAVMRQSPCAACDGFAVGLILKDVLDGGEVQLTSGLEFGAWPILSPDGHMVLVTGDKLRIYTEGGALRRAIDVPEGFSVTSAAWSPDGKRFAYVVGPKGVGGN